MSDQKADPAFEQRMITRFRTRVPQRTGLIGLLSNLIRFRAVQITAAAALLLALAQMGRLITGESLAPTRDDYISSVLEAQLKPGDGRTRGVDELATTKQNVLPMAPPSVDEAPPAPTSLDKSNARTLSQPKTKKADFKDEEARALTTSAT